MENISYFLWGQWEPTSFIVYVSLYHMSNLIDIFKIIKIQGHMEIWIKDFLSRNGESFNWKCILIAQIVSNLFWNCPFKSYRRKAQCTLLNLRSKRSGCSCLSAKSSLRWGSPGVFPPLHTPTQTALLLSAGRAAEGAEKFVLWAGAPASLGTLLAPWSIHLIPG